MKVDKHRDRLPGEAAEFPSLDVFWTPLDMALINLI